MLLSSGVFAQSAGFPSKPLRMLVGYPAGGSVDVTARVVSERLGSVLGQQVVVDNRPGATGNIAAELLAKAPPDGHTLYMGTSINAVSVSLFRSLGYDPLRDFAPVSNAVTTPSMLVVNPSVPARNVREFVALAKQRPGKLTYATTGTGSSPHLCAELLSTLAGIRMLHVPYKGGAPAITDLLGGHVDLSFSNIVSAIPHVKSGRMRALAVTGKTRFAQTPDVPTMVESGYPDFVLVAWYGVIAPAATPAPVVERLSTEIGRILQRADVKDLLGVQGLDATPTTPAELARMLRDDIAFYAKILKAAGVKPE
jgi:tripartite-type tricarboxylate transporter receptor subunit TctC